MFSIDLLPELFASELAGKWIIIMLSAALLCFFVSELTGNYSQVDKLWSLLPPVYTWVSWAEAPSDRLLLMSVLVTLWGFRLSYNFARKGGYNIIPWKGEEDYRWAVMKSKTFLRGRLRFGLFNLLFISLYQNLLIMLFTSPALLVASGSGEKLNITDIFAALFMLLFLITETVADNQQFRFHRFKKGAVNEKGLFTRSLKDGFLSEGLWAYSRHPNFLSEQGIWVSFYFFGVASSGLWLNITASGALLLITLFIGSTRLTESISRLKYPAYADYQKKVPKLVRIK
jgi:steroid 5-alpha reductase family enzyme